MIVVLAKAFLAEAALADGVRKCGLAVMALAACALGLAAAPASGQTVDGRIIMEMARDALGDITAIEARIKLSGDGALGSGIMAAGESDLRMARLAEPTDKMAFAVLLTGAGHDSPDNQQIQRVGVFYEAERTHWLDPNAKTLYTKDEALTELPRTLMPSATSLLWLHTLAQALPYERELAAGVKYKVKSQETVGGEVCDVVVVTYPKDDRPESISTRQHENADKSTWHIAVSDHLPRRIVWTAGAGMIPLNFKQEIVEIKANPPGLDLASLELEQPAEYTTHQVALGAFPAGHPQADSRTGRPQADQKPKEAPAPPKVVLPAAPDFKLVTADDEEVTKATVAGRVSVLYFWGTWSTLSDKVSPLLSTMTGRFKDQAVDVYGVAVRENSVERPAAHMAAKAYDFTLLVHPESPRKMDVARAFNVRRYPTAVVLTGEGRIAHTAVLSREIKPEEFIAGVEEAVRGQLKELAQAGHQSGDQSGDEADSDSADSEAAPE